MGGVGIHAFAAQYEEDKQGAGEKEPYTAADAGYQFQDIHIDESQ